MKIEEFLVFAVVLMTAALTFNDDTVLLEVDPDAVSAADQLILFMEVRQPKNLAYTYEIMLSKNIGNDFPKARTYELVYANPPHACADSLMNFDEVKNSIVLAERGECSFLSKAVAAENSGAAALLVTDSAQNDDAMVEMVADETDRLVNIPTAYLCGKDGRMMRQHLTYGDGSPILVHLPLNLTHLPFDAIKKPPWLLW